jgi:hypothetical protein
MKRMLICTRHDRMPAHDRMMTRSKATKEEEVSI